MGFRQLGSLLNFSHTYMGVTGKYNAMMIDNVAINDANVSIYPNKLAKRGNIQNIRLILELKINLIREDGSSVNKPRLDSGYTYTRWPEKDWEFFKELFISRANMWMKKFSLELTASGRQSSFYKQVEKQLSLYEDDPGVNTIVCPRIIDCMLYPTIVAPADAHCNVKCWYIADRDRKPLKSFSVKPFRANSGNLSNLDTWDEETVPHEIGHLLGLPHIGQLTANPSCVAVSTHASTLEYDLNEHPCYEDANRDGSDTMGHGLSFGTKDAYPWQIALQQITGIPYTSYKVATHRLNANAFIPETLEYGSSAWYQFHTSDGTFINEFRRP